MLIESISDASEGLSHILFATILATNTMYEIRAPTTDVFHAVVLLLVVVTDNFTSFAQEFAVSSIESIAKGKASFLLCGAQIFGEC